MPRGLKRYCPSSCSIRLKSYKDSGDSFLPLRPTKGSYMKNVTKRDTESEKILKRVELREKERIGVLVYHISNIVRGFIICRIQESSAYSLIKNNIVGLLRVLILWRT